MQIRTLMAVILAASLGAVVSGCQPNDDGTARPQSRSDSPMMQGTAPGAPTQGSNRGPTAGKQQSDSSSAGATTQPPDRDAAIASPSDESSKSDEASKQKGSS